MLIFGCCVGKSGKFERIAEPALANIMDPGDMFIREDGRDGICAAYNRILLQARDIPDCEGVVLIHDDTELRAGSREAILDGLRRPGVGVVGAIGGRGLFGPMWINSRRQSGNFYDTGGRRGPYRGAEPWVDVVDGLLIAVAPRAYSTLLFDEEMFPAFHGYDTDYCLAVRNAGFEVFVPDIDYHHHNKTDLGDAAAFHRSAEALHRKWPEWIKPLTPGERIALAGRRAGGLARHHVALRVKRLVRRG